MTNLICAILIALMIGIAADSMTRSVDCLSGNKGACELVAKRYETKP